MIKECLPRWKILSPSTLPRDSSTPRRTSQLPSASPGGSQIPLPSRRTSGSCLNAARLKLNSASMALIVFPYSSITGPTISSYRLIWPEAFDDGLAVFSDNSLRRRVSSSVRCVNCSRRSSGCSEVLQSEPTSFQKRWSCGTRKR